MAKRSKRKTPSGKRVYRVVAEMTISVHTDVVASSAAEAREKAMGHAPQSFCHSCSGTSREEWVTSGELDGEPQIIECEALDDDPEEFDE